MTHKSFYEAAASEIAEGRLDTALWIKVNAEMAGADVKLCQAKYIALRAQEMATERTRSAMSDWWSTTPRWVKVLGGVAIVLFGFMAILGALL